MPKKSGKQQGRIEQEIRQRLPVVKFIGGFIIFTIVFYLLTNASWFESFRTPLVSVYTKFSSLLLNIIGQGTSTSGSILKSSEFSVNVQEGCDAIIPTILYITAVLVFPTSWKNKGRGLLIGVPTLFLLNTIRIVTLFLTGVYAPKFFDFMHVEFWQAVFIICTVLLFISWLKSSTKNVIHEVK